ncbi:hypothetical protein Tco_0478944 [Tanacetum coccineum]
MVIKTLKERIKSLSGNMKEDKIKKDIEEIETINIELDHRVSKLIDENEHLKQTYKQLYDSIKPTRIRSKEQCDALINQVNQKFIEISDLNIDVEPIAPRLLNNKTTHSDYLRHTQEHAVILREIVEQGCRYAFTFSGCDPKEQGQKRVKPSTSASGSQPSGNTKKDKIQQTPSSTQKNKVEAHSRTVKSSLKNKNCVVEPKGTANVQHSKLNANSEPLCVKCNGCMIFDNHDLCVLDFINDVNARAKSKSVKKNSKRKVWKPTRKVFTNIEYTWRPTGRTFTIVGNAFPLTKTTTPAEMPLRKPTALETDTPKPVEFGSYGNHDRPTNVEVPKELPKVSMVNTSLKKLKYHLAGFDVVVKERTTPTAITKGSKDIVNTIVNSSVDIASVNVHECEKCLKLETELLNKKDFVEKEIYDKLFKSFTTFEKHCISLDVDTQLNQKIFQRDNSVSNQSAPSFDQLFELNELKAQS